jgi:hypothetical protein
MLQPPKKTLFAFASVVFQAHTLRSPFLHKVLEYASEKWSRHRCHVGTITITEGEYGEHEIHRAAGHDAAQKDVRQGVIDLEKKLTRPVKKKKMEAWRINGTAFATVQAGNGARLETNKCGPAPGVVEMMKVEGSVDTCETIVEQG